MSLLDAQRQRNKALEQRHGLGASKVSQQIVDDNLWTTCGTPSRGLELKPWQGIDFVNVFNCV